MKRITIIFWLLCLGLTALWIVADPVVIGLPPFAQLKIPLINFTGIIAMGAMSVSMVLALRSVAVEPHVGGLDKSYRLHKWLGVAGLVMAIAHWLLISPGWLVALGMASVPVSGAGARRVAEGPALLQTLRGPARGVGQWGFYGAVVLIVLALLRWFPYRYFIKTHRLLAIVFLILVFHSVVLLKVAYWSHVIAYAITALMAAGCAAALYILVRRVGRTRQAVGEIEAVTTHTGWSYRWRDDPPEGPLGAARGGTVRVCDLRPDGGTAPVHHCVHMEGRRAAAIFHQGTRRLHDRAPCEGHARIARDDRRSVWPVHLRE